MRRKLEAISIILALTFIGSCSDKLPSEVSLPLGTIIATIDDGSLLLKGNANEPALAPEIRRSLETHFPNGVTVNLSRSNSQEADYDFTELEEWSKIPKANVLMREGAVTVLAQGGWNEYRDGMYSMNIHSAPWPVRASIVNIQAFPSSPGDIRITSPRRQEQCQALFDHVSYLFRPKFDWPSMAIENWQTENAQLLVSLQVYCRGTFAIGVGSTPDDTIGLEAAKLRQFTSKLTALGVDPTRLKPLGARPREASMSPLMAAISQSEGDWLIFRYKHELP